MDELLKNFFSKFWEVWYDGESPRPKSRIEREGNEAYYDGSSVEMNPYKNHCVELAEAWERGFYNK